MNFKCGEPKSPENTTPHGRCRHCERKRKAAYEAKLKAAAGEVVRTHTRGIKPRILAILADGPETAFNLGLELGKDQRVIRTHLRQLRVENHIRRSGITVGNGKVGQMLWELGVDAPRERKHVEKPQERGPYAVATRNTNRGYALWGVV